jgi:hypothetical protein
MPDREEQEVRDRAKRDAAEGKSPSTQAGEFVREEIEHVRQGKHGARNTKQAIAIGLSKARRAGVNLPPPGRGQSRKVRKQVERDLQKGRSGQWRHPSARRSRATSRALRREGRSSASRSALSSQARSSQRRRGASARHQSSMRALRTKGKSGLRRASRKAARTRKSRRG